MDSVNKRLKTFTKSDCCRSMYDELPDGKISNEGRVCIIPLDKLKKKYRKPEYQLFRVKSGFGITPSARGNACYGHFCVDGERCRWEKFNFLGVGNEEIEKIAEELEKAWMNGIIKNSESRKDAEAEM